MANIITGDQDDNNVYGTWEDDILRGLGGDDFLMGMGGNDTLEGGAGNDRLENMGGNNTYLFGRGDGQDTILAYDSSLTKHNTIRFGEDIAPADIIAERVGDNLVLRIQGTTDSITVQFYFSYSGGANHPYAIEEVRFFDGATWDSLAILTKINPPIALDDDDNFFGGGSVDGKGGNDQLYGSWNDDVMRGGDGNDKLRSLDGDDFLIGGAGDDLLDGGRGVNTMLFVQGWGHDTIILSDMDVPAGTIIEIAGALPGTLLLSRSDDGAGNDLIISAKGASDTITVAGYFDQNYASAASSLRISYADGSIWNYDQIQQATWPMPPVFEQIGTEGNDWLQSDGGYSHLVGAGGDDQIYGGYGADALDGGQGMDNLVGSYGDDLLDGGAGDDTLQGDQGNDVLLGGDGNDNLSGGDGNDILDAGAGNAQLDGGEGNNFILFGRSAGEYRLLPAWNGINTIVLASDVRPEDIRVTSYNSWEISVEIKGSMARILMPLVADWQNGNYDQVLTRAHLQFADGTVWDDEILQRKRYTGDEESNYITGSQYGDWMDGQDGNDALHGMEGNDSMRGGRGDDFMDGGSGNDILLGQDGHDNLMGGDGDDFLNGGAGDDFLSGAMGNNVFQVDLHGGIDTIYTWYQQGAHNTLQFGEGIVPGDVLVRIDPNSGNLVVSFNGSQDQVTVVGYLDKYYGNPEGLNELRFANGVSWNAADIRRESTSGNDGDNFIDGTTGDDTMDGKGGNDILMGVGGDDVLLGGDGDDMLEGGTGNNTLIGGRGNDTLGGDVGTDTYVFNIGDGQDYIIEYSWGWGWQAGVEYATLPNTIRFGAGIAPTDLQFVQNGGTLYIYYGGQDSIAIPYTDTSGAVDKLPVDRFEFADNSVWTYRELINHAPELMTPVGEVWATEGHVLEFQIPSFTFFDPDPEALRYQLELPAGGDLPAWLHFDPLTGKITGTPGYGDSGEMDLKVTARDNVGATASDIFKLKVTHFDPAPKLSREIATQNATEASPFSITIAADTFVDPDGGPLSYQVVVAGGAPLPAWLNFDGATLSGIAGDADTGTLQLRLIAKDDGGNAVFADFALHVADFNQAPVLVQAIAGQSATEASPFSIAIPAGTFADADGGDVLSYSMTLIDGPLPAWLSFDSATKFLSGTPGDGDTGTLQLRLTATDSGGKSASTDYALDVANINQAPTLVQWPVNQSATEATPFSITFPADTFADADGGDVLSYSLDTHWGPIPAWLTFDSGTMTLSGTPGDADVGSVMLRLTATDSAGQTMSAGFELNVANVNQAPVLMQTIADQSATETSRFSITFPWTTFDDPDVRENGSLNYTMSLDDGPLPAWLNFDHTSMTLSGTPGDADTGILQLRLTAIDNGGNSVSAAFTLNVADINQAPVLVRSVAYLHSIDEASPFSVAIPAGSFADPDARDVLNYSMALVSGPLPAWLHFDAATMTLSGTPGDADTGFLSLVMTATDTSGKSVSSEFGMMVFNANQAPVLVQAPASQSVEDGVSFTYVLPANMFSDPDAGDSGVLAVDGLPAGFSFDAQSRTISGAASLAEVGAHALTVSFTDGGGLRTSAGFALTVTAAASISLTGSAGADALSGKSNSDVLRGLGGDDILNGGIGADRMEGGSGNDTFYVDNAGDLALENAAEGTDTVMASVSYALGANVERLTLTGDAAINATGNTLNNTITGNSGINVIDGGSGADSMAGGAGNDTYLVDNSSDAITEALGAGFDHVISSVGRSLVANQEALTLTGTAAINGNGNLLNNLVQGNSGVNSLTGGDGNDILQGGAGDDTLSDSSFAMGNLFDGGLGADRLTGGAGADLFIGGAGNDIINTSSGADIIAFNRSSGMDVVAVANDTDNTVSLGHGILYSDLSLAKSGNDLILKTGMGEQISFNGWYSSTNAHSVGTLQVVTEGGADYVAGSASAIHDNKIEQFNFTALVAKFDQLRAGQSSSFNWNMASSLEAFSNGGSDSAAIGGDLAYQYALGDSLAALSAMPALAIIGSPSFGVGSQALQGGAALNDGIAVLY